MSTTLSMDAISSTSIDELEMHIPYNPAQFLLSTAALSHPPPPPPHPPSSTVTPPTAEEMDLLQTLQFPDDDDSACEDDGDGTEPIDLSRGLKHTNSSSQSMMDPFRSALFSPNQRLSSILPAIPGDVLDIASDSETRLMSVSSLLRLLHLLTTEQEGNKTQVMEVSGRDDEVLDSLLDEERRAQEDEYIEKSHFSSTVSKYHTRGSAEEAQPSLPEENDSDTNSNTIMQDQLTTTTTTSSSSSSCFSQTESQDLPLFLSDDKNLQSISLISHPSYSGDEAEVGITYQIDNGIRSITANLRRAFVYFMIQLLPQTTIDMPQQILPRIHWFFSYQFRPGSLLPSLTEEFRRFDSGSAEEKIAAQIMKILLFSSCSESSCERLFSRARFVVGKRRYQLSRRALFSSLLVSDLALKKFLEDD